MTLSREKRRERLSTEISHDSSTSSRGHLALIFVLAAGSFFYVNIGSQLYAVEIALAFGLLLALPSHSARPKLGHGLALGMLLWTFSSLLSDLFVANETLNLVKGVLRVLFFATDVFALYYLCFGSAAAVLALWWGIAFSGFLGHVIQPPFAAAGEPWKFGIGLSVTLLIVLWLAQREHGRLVTVAAFVGIAGVHFALGFRSMASITAICGLLMAVRVGSRYIAGPRLSRVRLRPIVLGIVGIVGILALSSVYDGLATQGYFGAVAQSKAAYQAGGAYGSSFSSRNEIFLSLQTIAQSPFIGGGSYSVATAAVSENAAVLLNNLGYSDVASRLLEGAPAYHSEILGIWAENGLLTLFFWLPVGALLVRSVFAVVYRETRLAPLVLFLSITGLWDLLFSPFGADRRMWVAATIVAVIVARAQSAMPREERNASDLDHHH